MPLRSFNDNNPRIDHIVLFKVCQELLACFSSANFFNILPKQESESALDVSLICRNVSNVDVFYVKLFEIPKSRKHFFLPSSSRHPGWGGRPLLHSPSRLADHGGWAHEISDPRSEREGCWGCGKKKRNAYQDIPRKVDDEETDDKATVFLNRKRNDAFELLLTTFEWNVTF